MDARYLEQLAVKLQRKQGGGLPDGGSRVGQVTGLAALWRSVGSAGDVLEECCTDGLPEAEACLELNRRFEFDAAAGSAEESAAATGLHWLD